MTATRVAILAAGAGRRFGGGKQLALFNGKPLLQHTIDHCRGLGNGVSVTLILGCDAARIADGVDHTGVNLSHNPGWEEGIASSIRTAVDGVPADCHHLLLIAADQPLVTTTALAGLLALAAAQPDTVVAAAYAGTLGIPAVFPQPWFAQLAALRGDTGAGALLRASKAVVEFELPEAGIDIDTPAALRALTAD